MEAREIRKFVERVLPELDEPGTYVPCINQYLTKEEDWGEDKTRICYVLPVPESASIQNLGIAILTQIGNEMMGDEYLASVCYFPEIKMWRRMKKNNIPMFDNWLFHDLKDFDIIGFSSFYSLQYLNFIQMLKQMELPYKAEERRDSWDTPIVALGGIQAYSAESVADIFDVFMIGEGEDMNVQFMQLLRKCKKEGMSKKDFLYLAAKTIQGVYLPWAYEVEYFDKEDPDRPNQIKSIKLTEEAKAAGVPQKVLKGCIEFRDRAPVNKTFVSNNSGGSMSIGSDYCANSCSNLCSFCQGSQISLPYREVPMELAKKSALDIINNTGTKDISPYCFNVSDLSYVNRFTRDLLLEHNMKVSLSSERLDTMNDDFVAATIKSGSRSFTVAIEAASPRGRHILNKNLTEEQILNAFEIMFRQGATRIKVYNIASWPFEQEEDRMYYVDLVAKIEELRKRLNAKTQIRLSFTPFQAKPHTMLQWAKMENVEVDENNNPVFLKTYNNMMEGVKEVCDYRFRFGTASNVSLVAQALAFGDRRLFPVVEAIANDPEVKYYGGMGAGSQIVEVFTKYMRELTPYDWDFFIREKGQDEIFPWEVISTGVDKSWLLKMYNKAKAAADTPVSQEGRLRAPCYKACTACGVCKSTERSADNFWPAEIYGEGRKLPVFKYEDHAPDQINMEEVLAEYIKPQKLRVFRLEADINPKYRYVDPQKLKYRIRRACNRAGIPIRTDVASASDKILEKAWFSGKEIYELYSADKRFNISSEDTVRLINENFADDAIRITRAEWYSGTIKALRDNFEYVLYSLTLNNEDFSYLTAKEEIDFLNSTEEYLMKIKVKSKTKRDAFETIEMNVKDNMYKCFARNNDDGTWTLFAALSDNVAIYDFAATLLKTSKRNLYKYPAIVEEYLLRQTAGAALDMFSGTCLECGGEIETNIWGEDLTDTYCLEHYYSLNFEHRDSVLVEQGYSEEFEDEEDTTEFDVGGHDDDDEDTDLEDEIIAKTGGTGI